jgi:hypothetical protein
MCRAKSNFSCLDAVSLLMHATRIEISIFPRAAQKVVCEKAAPTSGDMNAARRAYSS